MQQAEDRRCIVIVDEHALRGAGLESAFSNKTPGQIGCLDARTARNNASNGPKIPIKTGRLAPYRN